jgi:hypothetical protein
MPTLKVTGQKELYFNVATRGGVVGTLGGPMASLDAAGHSSLRAGCEPPGRILAMQKEKGTSWVTGNPGPVCTTGQRSRRADGGCHEVAPVREIDSEAVDFEDNAANEEQLFYLFNMRLENNTDTLYNVDVTGYGKLAGKTGGVPIGQKVRYFLGPGAEIGVDTPSFAPHAGHVRPRICRYPGYDDEQQLNPKGGNLTIEWGTVVEGTLVALGPTVYLAIAQGEYVIGYTRVFEEVGEGTKDHQQVQCVHEISGQINRLFYQDALPALSPLKLSSQ